MAAQALTPYHIGQQSAGVLLGPIATELARLEARLVQYHDRLRMADEDRATIACARDLFARAAADLAAIASAR